MCRSHAREGLILEKQESRFPVYSLISVVEDDTLCQESSRLLPGVRNVLLASLSDAQRHGREGLLDKLETHLLIYSISIVENHRMCQESSRLFSGRMSS